MSEQQFIKVLELAERSALPDRIEDDSVVPVSIVKELYEGGFLDAIDASSADGSEYMEPRINVRGREYLKVLKQQHYEVSPRGKAKRLGVRLLDWVGGIVAGLIIAWVASKYFK
jgi:hypothetical protein